MSDNRLTFTFTSDGTDGDVVRFAYIRPELGTSQSVVLTFVNTESNLAEIEIDTTVPPDVPGTLAAQNYSVRLDAVYNAYHHFFIERADNVVTITLTNPNYSFNFAQNDLGTHLIETVVVPESVEASIEGQELTNQFTYCYLYEPLLASITDFSTDVTKTYVQLVVYNTADSTLHEVISSYGEFDLIAGKPLQIDLMEMARQYHDSKVYKLGKVEDIPLSWESVVSRYKYEFIISTNGGSFINKVIKKLPIIGGRGFQEFEPLVSSSTSLNEADKFGIDLTSRFKGFPTISTTLADPTLNDSRPTISIVPSDGSGCKTVAALIWKSYLGGWMMWGFSLEDKSFQHKYNGSLEVKNFESTSYSGGHIYKPVDYTGVSTSKTIKLKALSLISNELEAVSRVNYTPAIYYVTADGKMELMRISSVSAPLDSKANGGDFQVTLNSIGSVDHSTL